MQYIPANETLVLKSKPLQVIISGNSIGWELNYFDDNFVTMFGLMLIITLPSVIFQIKNNLILYGRAHAI